jgi:hypothetical protein
MFKRLAANVQISSTNGNVFPFYCPITTTLVDVSLQLSVLGPFVHLPNSVQNAARKLLIW